MNDAEEIKTLLRQILAVQLLNGAELQRICSALEQGSTGGDAKSPVDALRCLADGLTEDNTTLQSVMRELPSFS